MDSQDLRVWLLQVGFVNDFQTGPDFKYIVS